MAIPLGEAIGYIKLNIDGFQKGMQDVKAQSAQLDNIAAGVGKAFDVAAKAAAAALAAITAASALAVKQTLQAGSAFEAAMSQVAATMGMSAEEITNNADAYMQLSNAAKEAGATTKFSATQAAEALNYLALAGYSVEDSISTLPTILNVAAAGGMELAAASDMVTDAMSALGLSVDEAASFADKLAKTSQKSNTSIAQLGAGILQIGGTAKSLAGGVDELNTALGILANNGIKAAEGGTALRQLVLNLTAPSEKAAAYMEELGFSAYDAAGNMKPLNQVFAELDEIMSRFSTQKEKDNVLTQIFDARQLKSARALLSNYGDSWDNLYEQISNANGAAEIMAETMNRNLQGAITIAKSAIEAVQVTAYEGLQKGLTQAVETATQAINRLNETLATQEMQEALQAISKSAGELIVKFTEFIVNVIPKAINLLNNLGQIANVVKSAFIGGSIALTGFAVGLALNTKEMAKYISKLIAAKFAVVEFNKALSFSNPYILLANVIGVAAGALTLFISEVKRQNEELKESIVINDELVASANKLEDAYNSVTYSAEEKAGETINEINNIRTLTNNLVDLAKQEELTAEQLIEAKDIIEQLNDLYPKNTAYIQDGQIVGYEGLAEAVKHYTDNLYYASQLELARTQTGAAQQTMEEAATAMEEARVAANEASIAYADVSAAREAWLNGEEIDTKWFAKMQEEGRNNMTLFLKDLEEAYAENLEAATDAYEQERQIWDKANDDYETAMERRIAIEEWYSTQSETFRLQRQTQLDRGLHDPSAEAAMQEAETKKEHVKQVWKDIAELDKEYQMGRIASEEEFQTRRAGMLESIWNENDEKWVQEYSKSVKWRQGQEDKINREAEQRQKEAQRQQEEAEKEKQKELEDYIEGQWESFETRHKNDVNYTEKNMLDDMEKSLEVLDKDSDLFNEYSKELSEKRSDWAEDERKKQQETAESNFEVWQEAYEKIADEAEETIADIKSRQESLADSLVNSVKLYETKSTEVWNKEKQQWERKEEKIASAKSIKNQTKDLEDYMAALDSLKEKGLSENVMAQILGMSPEDGSEFAKQLDQMTQSELNEYGAAVDELNQKAQQYSVDFYAPQMDKAKQDYNTALEKWKKSIPADWQKVGEETVNGFIKGIEERAADGENAASGFISGTVDDVKNLLGIHSPSTVFADIGTNVVAGLINGLNDMRESLYKSFSNMGINSANKYVEGFRSVWNSFMKNMPDISGSLAYTSPYELMNSTSKPKTTYTEYTGGGYSLTRTDITKAVKEALPDNVVVPVHLDGKQIARYTVNYINDYNLNSGGSVIRS